MSNFPNSNLYGYGFQQSSQQLNYPPPIIYCNVYYNNMKPSIIEKSFKIGQFHQENENVSNLKGSAIRKCRARYGLERRHEWCKGCCQKKKCTRYKNSVKEPPLNEIVSPENTINYSTRTVYRRPRMPMVNVMLGY